MIVLVTFLVKFLMLLTSVNLHSDEGPEDVLSLADNIERTDGDGVYTGDTADTVLVQDGLSSPQGLEEPQSVANAYRIRGEGPVCSRLRGDGPFAEFRAAHPSDESWTSRTEAWALFLAANFDLYMFLVFLAIGYVVYLTTSYAMPYQLSLNIVSYFIALFPSQQIRRFIHPIFTCAALTIFGIWIIGLTAGQSLQAGLREYSTGSKYLSLFTHPPGSLPFPGAADILSSVLDASIVSLAIPMFNFRKELRKYVSMHRAALT